MAERRLRSMGVNQLPEDALQHIFSYLSFRQKLQATRVCSRWRCVLRKPSVAWQSLLVDTATLTDGVTSQEREQAVRYGLERFIANVGSCVTRLEIVSNDSDITRRNHRADDILTAFLPAVAASLEALYCEPVSISYNKTHLLERCKQLKRLDIAFDGSGQQQHHQGGSGAGAVLPNSGSGYGAAFNAGGVAAFLPRLATLERLKLDLGVSVPMPPTVLALTGLTHLSMELLAGVPPCISRLTVLRKLALTDYHGPHTFPEALSGLTSLQELHIDWHFEDDSAEVQLPSSLSNLSHLRQLSLTPNCRLSGYSSLAGLSDLACLYLDCCRMRVIPEALSSLCELRELGVTANRVSELPAWLSRLRRLRAVDLSYQSIGALRLAPEVLLMPSLKKLYLVEVDGCGISTTCQPCMRLVPCFNYPRQLSHWDLAMPFAGDVAATAAQLGSAAQLHTFVRRVVEFAFDEAELMDPWSID